MCCHPCRHRLTNSPASSQGHNNGTVNVASTAGTKSTLANKAGTFLVMVTCLTIGLAATVTTLTSTTSTIVLAGNYGPDGRTADTAPNGTLAIEAGPPKYDATLTATPMSTAPSLGWVHDINNDDNDNNKDNTLTTGNPTIAHPISWTTLHSIPEVHDNSHTPPPWVARLEDHATQLEAMVHFLVADSSESKQCFTHINEEISAFNKWLDSLHNNLLTDVLASADAHIITSVTNTLTQMMEAIINKKLGSPFKNGLDFHISKHI